MWIDWFSNVLKYQRRLLRSATLVHSVISSIFSPAAEFTTEPLGMSNWLRIWKPTAQHHRRSHSAPRTGCRSQRGRARWRGEAAEETEKPAAGAKCADLSGAELDGLDVVDRKVDIVRKIGHVPIVGRRVGHHAKRRVMSEEPREAHPCAIGGHHITSW